MFTITQYQVLLRIHKPIIFNTYPGFYLRNALVNALVDHCHNPNRVNNHRVTNCQGCRQLQKCAYAALHLPVQEPDGIPGIMPFSLHVPDLIFGKYQTGEISFELRLFGNADKFAGLFVKSLENIGQDYGIGENGQPGSFSLVEMQRINVVEANEILTAPPPPLENLTLSFRHLKLSDKMMETRQNIPFDLLMQLLTSRMAELAETFGNNPGNNSLPAFHSDGELMCRHTAQLAKCNYQYAGSRQGYWFFNGQLHYEGNLTPYYNLLRVGGLTGIGRFTSYGFGTYSIRHE